MTHINWLVLLLVSTIAIHFAQSELLAESTYPMKGANPQRNHRINKKILCPEVAPGRTQVWNIESEIHLPAGVFLYGDIQLTTDEEVFIYLSYVKSNKLTYNKINATSSSYDFILSYESPFATDSYPIPTHVKGHKLYATDGVNTVVLNTTTMQEIALLPNSIPAERAGNYAPFGSDLMLTSNYVGSYTDVLTYLNATTLQFNTSLLFNYQNRYTSDVIIYKNASGVEFPIFIVGYESLFVVSPHYQFMLDATYPNYRDSYVQDDQLIIQYQKDRPNPYIISIYDANNGTFIRSFATNNAYGEFKVFGTKAIGSTYSDRAQLIDPLNGNLILDNTLSYETPRFSIPSNSALLLAQKDNIDVVISLDWDTQTINAIGSFPIDGYYGDHIVSPPLIGEDCALYSYLSDGHYNNLFVFKPLPLSNVMPILECINSDGLAYISYHNYENKHIIIPYLSDRNNLSPMNVTPAQDFKANYRTKHFPFSSQFKLDSSTTSFTWILEDYTLAFNSPNQHLRCPENVEVVISFNSNATSMPEGFPEWTRQAFVNLAHINSTRVNVTSSSINQTAIEVRLIVSPDPNGQEKSPEEVVRSFDPTSNINTLNLLVSNSNYTSDHIVVNNIDGVQLDSEIDGVRPPHAAPINPQPIDQPPTSDSPLYTQPNSNDTPKSTPKSTQVSSGLVQSISGVVMAIALVVSF